MRPRIGVKWSQELPLINFVKNTSFSQEWSPTKLSSTSWSLNSFQSPLSGFFSMPMLAHLTCARKLQNGKSSWKKERWKSLSQWLQLFHNTLSPPQNKNNHGCKVHSDWDKRPLNKRWYHIIWYLSNTSTWGNFSSKALGFISLPPLFLFQRTLILRTYAMGT